MKGYISIATIITTFILVGCNQPSHPFVYEEDVTLCQEQPADSIGDFVPIQSIQIVNGQSLTNEKNFIQTCVSGIASPLVMAPTLSYNHQLIFNFDAIYPIQSIEVFAGNAPMVKVEKLTVDFSTNLLSYSRLYNAVNLPQQTTILQTNGQYAKAVKFTFLANQNYLGFADIRFNLAAGFIGEFSESYSQNFLRTSGWTGADGIFSYDLNHGGDEIGVTHDTTGFVFSDTFVGEVNPTTMIRQAPTTLINNSFGYLDHTRPLSHDAFSFAYEHENGIPISPVKPDAFTGYQVRNLLDSDGFIYAHAPTGQLTNKDEGISWLSPEIPVSILFDFLTPQPLASMYLWNYNAVANYGAKTIAVYAGLENQSLSKLSEITLPKASGNSFEPYTEKIDFSGEMIRYVRLEILEGYTASMVGLGKIIFHDTQGVMLFAKAEATATNPIQSDAERKPRLWLQDGFVNEGFLYNFPLLIKNDGAFFSVNSVGLVQIPIINQRFVFSESEYVSTPLMTRAPDNGLIFFGAGVMDHRPHDGYIYVYGYKDLQGRHLIAARLLAEDVFNFNRWEYFAGENWSSNIHDAKGIKSEVSAELSVTRIPSGYYQGKYMLTVMKSTLSGSVAYAMGDSPVGPFGDYHTIYQTTEHTQFNGGFTYNAKLHPNLSSDDLWWVSYNVNSTNFSALMNANIYYPRFISLRQIKAM